MSKVAVRYNNDMNTIPFRNFTATELDLFFTICANIKEKGTDVLTFDFDKLRELSNYEPTSLKRFADDLDKTYKKLIELNIRLDYENGDFERFALFNRYRVSMENKTIEIQVNELFKYILNDLNIGNFTRFELAEFTELSSTYSKAIYRLIKQWKTVGKWEVDIDEFRRLLDIPESYKMGNIDQQILNPALKDLSPYFNNLKVKKLDRNKRSSGRGRPVKFIQFTFTPQDDKKEWLESKERKPKENELFYGKYNNVYLSDDEVHTIIYEWHMKYLIDELSEWKYKTNPKTKKSDFELIKAFKKEKEKDQVQDIMNLYK